MFPHNAGTMNSLKCYAVTTKFRNCFALAVVKVTGFN